MHRFVIHPGVSRLLVVSILASAFGLAARSSSAAVVQEEAQERGLYTAAQASRGRDIYRAHCAVCHGSWLDDGVAVALVGPDFLGQWGTPAPSLDDLFFILRTTMPRPAAGSLAKAGEYAQERAPARLAHPVRFRAAGVSAGQSVGSATSSSPVFR